MSSTSIARIGQPERGREHLAAAEDAALPGDEVGARDGVLGDQVLAREVAPGRVLFEGGGDRRGRSTARVSMRPPPRRRPELRNAATDAVETHAGRVASIREFVPQGRRPGSARRPTRGGRGPRRRACAATSRRFSSSNSARCAASRGCARHAAMTDAACREARPRRARVPRPPTSAPAAPPRERRASVRSSARSTRVGCARSPASSDARGTDAHARGAGHVPDAASAAIASPARAPNTAPSSSEFDARRFAPCTPVRATSPTA